MPRFTTPKNLSLVRRFPGARARSGRGPVGGAAAQGFRKGATRRADSARVRAAGTVRVTVRAVPGGTGARLAPGWTAARRRERRRGFGAGNAYLGEIYIFAFFYSARSLRSLCLASRSRFHDPKFLHPRVSFWGKQASPSRISRTSSSASGATLRFSGSVFLNSVLKFSTACVVDVCRRRVPETSPISLSLSLSLSLDLERIRKGLA